MMLHENMIPGQFFLDFKNDFNTTVLKSSSPTNTMDIYRDYNFRRHQEHQQRLSSPMRDGEVLDLSRRCDSVETRKTPSPYNSTSSYGTASPSTQCGSPPNSTQTTSKSPSMSLLSVQNNLAFPQATIHQGIPAIFPQFYPNIKQEISSPPPPTVPVIVNPLSVYPKDPAAVIQQTRNNTTRALYQSPKQESPKSNSISSNPTEPSILYPSILNAATTGSINSGKHTRPFNAYPRDPLLVAAHFAASDVLWDKTTMERYSTYRKRALDDLRDTNGGHRVVTNPKMRRTNNNRYTQNSECEERAIESSDNDSSTGNGSSAETSSNQHENNENNATCTGGVKDEAYYERRRKNNAAAKKSRDRRRIKEDEIAIRAAYLERQNIELLCQIDALKKQLENFTKA